jgi:transposase
VIQCYPVKSYWSTNRARPSRQLTRREVGALPLIQAILERMRLRAILLQYIPTSKHQAFPQADLLVLLLVNLTLGKDPLYKLAQWIEGLELQALGYESRPAGPLQDDRFGRALDKLYQTDRTSLLTELVASAIRAFGIDSRRLHNDSTSLKAFGRIPGKTHTGLELRRGHSKDHRPDLRQLVYSLSVSDDGAIPIHHRLYPGNRNDDTTHIETWNALCQIHGSPKFLYVADCKLCTQSQLSHIVGQGGKAITILPHNLVEVRRFYDQLRVAPLPKKLLWRRPKPNAAGQTESYYLFEGSYFTEHGPYPLYWYYSSQKRQRDRRSRQERLEVAEGELAQLAPRLNGYQLKRQAQILGAAQGILEHYGVKGFMDVRLQMHRHVTRKPPRGRPPGQKAVYRYERRVSYSLHWSRNTSALAAEARTDGVIPLLCTDPAILPKAVLQAYKFQPRLEKRFCQLKSVHRAAPLLFKKIGRVEANLCLFFMALLVQALLERELRQKLRERRSPPLKLYPEDRAASHPTTSQVFKTFERLSTYVIAEKGRFCEAYHDQLNETHRAVLSLLDMTEQQFWN